jgi:hypothetical protein
MKLRLSIKIVMIVYLLILISFAINLFCFELNKNVIAPFCILITTYPVAFIYYFYYIYQYFFVKKDIEQVFPGKTLDLLIANNIDNLSHGHTSSSDMYSTYGICAKLAGLTVQYWTSVGIGNNLTISGVEIPYYYDAHSKIVKMIYKKMQNNRESQNIKKQQEIINNLKN